MGSSQATPEGIDETVAALDGGAKDLAMNVALNQIEGWFLSWKLPGSRSWSP